MQRRVDVPSEIRLDRLHLVFQAALGWTNSHLYEIRAGDVGWGIVDPDWGDGPQDATKTRLLDMIEDVGVKTLKYLYDFGDGWEHTVKIERIADAVSGLSYPVLLDATGRCPPEGVGGPGGYGALLEALADPDHERHDELTQWIGRPVDPLTCDADQLAKSVDTFTRKMGAQANAAAEDKLTRGASPDAYRSQAGWRSHGPFRPPTCVQARRSRNSFESSIDGILCQRLRTSTCLTCRSFGRTMRAHSASSLRGALCDEAIHRAA